MVIKLGRDIMPTNIFTKFVKDQIKLFDLESRNPKFNNFRQFKGHNSGVPGGIWQVIELGRGIMPTNIFTKFDKDRMKTLTYRA